MRKERFLPGKGQSLYLLIILFAIYTVIYMSKNIFTAALASIVEAGVMKKSQTGAISAAFWLFYGIFQIPGGLAADKFKPAHLITMGVVGAIIVNLIIYFFPIYEVIMVAWICNAVIQFGLWPGIFKIVTTQLHPELRKAGMFWMIFGTTLGLGLSLMVASFMTHWLQNFLVSVGILTIILVIWLASYRVLEKKMVEAEVPLPKMPSGAAPAKVGWSEMLKTGIWGLAIAAFLRTMVDNGIKMLTPVMLMESYEGLPAAISTRLSVILAVFAFFGVLLLKVFQKYVTENEAKGVSLVLAVVLPMLVVVCFVGKVHYLLVLGVLCLVAMLVSIIGPYSGSFCAGRFAKWGKSGTVAGFINALAALGNIGASYGLTLIAEHTSWSVVILVCIVLLGLASLICFLVAKPWTKFIEG